MGNTPIIDDLTLSLQPNEIVAILGPSGCGKTSFLNILSGIIPPSGGDIVLNGKPIAGRSRLCSYMFQDDLLFPWR
ncbi:MAG: hypothetical protein RI894_1649, partial [Bacteroidota bacterium]